MVGDCHPAVLSQGWKGAQRPLHPLDGGWSLESNTVMAGGRNAPLAPGVLGWPPGQCKSRCFPGRCLARGARDPFCTLASRPPLSSRSQPCGPCDCSGRPPPQPPAPCLPSRHGPVLPTPSLRIRFVRFCCVFHCSRPWALPSIRPAGSCPVNVATDDGTASPAACREGLHTQSPRPRTLLSRSGRGARPFQALSL